MSEPVNRRLFIIGIASTTLVSLTRPVKALEPQCPAPGYPPSTCSVMIDPQRFITQRTYRNQPPNSQWCWAACVSMICKWHGYDLSQPSIVQQTYGSIVNMPADDLTLTRVLNRVWKDDNGERFRMTAEIFSPMLGKNALTDEKIIASIQEERPLLYGARTHATVLARVDYAPTPAGPKVLQAHVIDPYPGAAPPPFYARILAPDEIVPMTKGGSLRYLASIKVEPV